MAVRVFLSYSHDDVTWRDAVLKHLGGLLHTGQLVHFDDRQIKPGEEWDARIKGEFLAADSTRGKTPGTSKPLIELIFSNITTSPTRGCEEVLHRIAQRPIAIYSGAKVINHNIFLRLLLNFQLAIRNRQTISIRGAE